MGYYFRHETLKIPPRLAQKAGMAMALRYKQAISPEMAGRACFPEWWKKLEQYKLAQEEGEKLSERFQSWGKASPFTKNLGFFGENKKREWDEYVGM